MGELGSGLPAAGHYARKQLGARSWFLSWSHGSRFRTGRKLVEPLAGCRLLDYGCGDGTFLALVHDLFPGAVGADIDAAQLADCRQRFAGHGDVLFVPIEDLVADQHAGAYGLVVCMEVLEHCLGPVVHKVLSDLRRLVRSDGHLLISVPIEIGPSLVAKQLLRRVAAWRGDVAYRDRETYRAGEFWKMVIAGSSTAIDRPVHGTASGVIGACGYHGHKGFNWRALRQQLDQWFEVQRVLFSPLGWLRGYLSSQVWFLCVPRR